MTSLFKTELRRSVLQRWTKVVVALVMLWSIASAVRLFLNYSNLNETQLAAGRVAFSERLKSQKADVEECERRSSTNFRDSRGFCIEKWAGGAARKTGIFLFITNMGVTTWPGILLFLISAALAVALTGSDWESGQNSVTLQWEPRRLRVLLSKTLAVAVICLTMSLAAILLHLLATIPVAWMKGTFAGMDGDWWKEFGLRSLRYSLAMPLAAVVGVSLSTLLRRTSIALVVLFAVYAEDWIRIPQNVQSIFGRKGPFLSLNFFIVGSAGDRLLPDQFGRIHSFPMNTTWEAGGLLALTAIVMLVLAAWIFASRDVTGPVR